MAESFHHLMQTFHQPGEVRWIGLRTVSRGPVVAVEKVHCAVSDGLDGDRYRGSPGGKRQVTLIQAEHLPVVAALLKRDSIDPALLRRNIVVAGINLHALRKMKFRIGEAVLEGTGDCDPCSRMEEVLGPGGYQALRGHGGITATVLEAGWIGIGDRVTGLGTPPAREVSAAG